MPRPPARNLVSSGIVPGAALLAPLMLSAAGEHPVADIMTRRWPVDPRLGCRQQGAELEVVMGAPSDDSAHARVPLLRKQAQACLERQLLALRPLEKANQDLPAAASEERAALARAPGVAARGASGAPDGGSIADPTSSQAGGP